MIVCICLNLYIFAGFNSLALKTLSKYHQNCSSHSYMCLLRSTSQVSWFYVVELGADIAWGRIGMSLSRAVFFRPTLVRVFGSSYSLSD